MGAITLKCKDKGAIELFEYMTQQEGVPEPDFDMGYPVIDYHDYHHTEDHKGKTVGAGDQSVQCEEIWETALARLDEWGADAHWKEEIDPKNANAEDNKAIGRYQKLRSLIEGSIQRPIPWVLNAPTITKSGRKSRKEKEMSLEKREMVVAAIAHLKEKILIDIRKEDEMKYQKALVAGLFWFALIPEGKRNVSREATESLKKFGLEDFETYLRQHGGLGLAKIDEDARLEATAMETLTGMRGLCTEQSKVLFAVMRMAGIKAHFIEPQLSIDYYYAHKNEKIRKVVRKTIPFLGHMASGVAIEIQNGHPESLIWILDPALQMLEPDYSKKSPYWILSLRHFLMMDLANLAGNQIKLKKMKEAQETLKRVFHLGNDSAAYSAYANYSKLLSERPHTPSLSQKCTSAEGCAKVALDHYRYDSGMYYNYGLQLKKRTEYQDALIYFLAALDRDPRFHGPKKEIMAILQMLRRNMTAHGDFYDFLEKKYKELEEIKKKHPSLEVEFGSLYHFFNQLRSSQKQQKK